MGGQHSFGNFFWGVDDNCVYLCLRSELKMLSESSLHLDSVSFLIMQLKCAHSFKCGQSSQLKLMYGLKPIRS